MTKQLTKQTIGVGVAGTGFIGPAHVEGLRRNGITVLGLAENTMEKAQQKAAELGIPRVYGSLDEMLADPDIDIVPLAPPNSLHYPHAKAALLGIGLRRGRVSFSIQRIDYHAPRQYAVFTSVGGF